MPIPSPPPSAALRSAEPLVSILLAADPPAQRLAWRAVLDDPGLNLVDASGEEALGRLAEDDFAVVLLDVSTPGLDGCEIAQRIRSQERSRHTPILFLSASVEDCTSLEQAFALGGVDCLGKPFVPALLRCKVALFVELFGKTRQIHHLQQQALDQKLAEDNARLRESELRFTRFMQHLPGLAWAKDLQGRYVYANEAAEAAFRVRRADLYGKTDEEVFPPATAAQFRANDQRALTSESGFHVIETLKHDDGIIHHSLVSKFPIPGPEGQPALVGGMAIDVTDRLRAEEEIVRLNRELRSRVEALAEADRRKDEFLAMLAHELRNPLAPIRNALHILKLRNLDGGLQTQVRDMMERQVQHLVRLVDDLLDVSRIMRGKIVLRKELTPLRPIVERAVETAQPVLDTQGHALDVVLPAETVWLEADSVRLTQVVANLLNNAAKYTEHAGRIRLAARQEGSEIVLRVQDNGIGIAPDLLPKVFDLFMQADRSLDRSQGGLGIGLTLVKRLVEMHGGRVEAHSAGTGLGSEFIVRLPAATELSGEDSGTDPSAAPLPCRRVLVVDDNVDAGESIALLLRLLRQDVRVVHSGPAALAAAAEVRPDLVLLDIGLPGMSGYEVAQRLREQAGARQAFLVAVTGYGQDEDRQRTRAAGFDLHLVKPVDPEELRRLLVQPLRAEAKSGPA